MRHLLMAVAWCVFLGPSLPASELTLELRVTDDAGNPVSGVRLGYTAPKKRLLFRGGGEEWVKGSVTTAESGTAPIRLPAGDYSLLYVGGIRKRGYLPYASSQVHLSDDMTAAERIISIRLERLRDPVPMRVFQLRLPWPRSATAAWQRIPVDPKLHNGSTTRIVAYPEGTQGPWGVDLQRIDWMPPHGRGEYADIFIGYSLSKNEYARRDSYWPYATTIILSATGSAGGFQVIPTNYRRLRAAPADGYQSVLQLRQPVYEDGTVINTVAFEDAIVFRYARPTEQGDIAYYYGTTHLGISSTISDGPHVALTCNLYLGVLPNNRSLEIGELIKIPKNRHASIVSE